MPPEWLSTAGATATALGGVIAFAWFVIKQLQPSMREEREQSERIRKRDRRRLRRSWDWGDSMEAWVHARRMERRRHDEQWHATDAGAIGNEDLPEDLAMGIRAYASQEDEDD